MDTAIRYLDLSREELAFVMQRLGIPELIGLEGGPLVLVDEGERPAAIAAGARGLVARGLAQQTSGGAEPSWALSQLLIATVGTCAVAADYAIITQRTPELPIFAWYAHLTPGLSVLHTLADAGVHRFSLCLEPTDLLGMLQAILDADGQAAPVGISVQVDSDVLDVAADLVRREPETARNVLLGADVESTGVEQLLKILKTNMSSSMVTRARYVESETEVLYVFGVVATPEGLWLTEPVAEQPGQVTVRPVAGCELSQRLAGLLDVDGGQADQS